MTFHSTLFWSLNGNPPEVRGVFESTGQTEASLIAFLNTVMDLPREREDLLVAVDCITGVGSPVPQLPGNAKWLLDRWVSWDCDPALPELLKAFHANLVASGNFAFGALLRANVPGSYLQAAFDVGMFDDKLIAEAWLAGTPTEYLAPLAA